MSPSGTCQSGTSPRSIQDHEMAKSHNVDEVKTASEKMMLVAVEQIKKRLPSAENMFENLRKTSPQIILSHIRKQVPIC